MERFVGRAVRSALRSAGPDVEVLVLDDGSTDNTQQAIAPFVTTSASDYDPRVRVYHHANRGKPATINRGFELAQGDYITILDADDELPADSLRVRWEKATSGTSQADCVVGGFKVIDEQSQEVGKRPAPSTASTSSLRRQYFVAYHTPFHLNACLLHRSLVRRVGCVDPQLTRCEDIDYALRVLAQSHTFRVTPSLVYCYRKYRTSRRERIHMRWITLKKRYAVLKRHAPPPLSVPAALLGVMVDALKLGYEVSIGNYTS